jgi:hypothetical protein
VGAGSLANSRPPEQKNWPITVNAWAQARLSSGENHDRLQFQHWTRAQRGCCDADYDYRRSPKQRRET